MTQLGTPYSSTFMEECRKLYPFQKESLSFLLDNKRAILADEMGLGKTVVAIEAIRQVKPLTTLIVAPKSLTRYWEQQLIEQRFHEKWRIIRYEGTPAKRAKIQLTNEPIICICSYQMLGEVLKKKDYWALSIFDESHTLKNRKAKTLYIAARKLRTNYLFLLTGTPPLQKSAADMWTHFNLLDRKTFSSFWKFVDAYCYKRETPFGQEIYGIKNPKGFERLMQRYGIRHLKSDVLSDLPDKTIQKIPVEMSKAQARIHAELRDEMISELEDEKLLTVPNVLAMFTRQRQLLVHPRLIGADMDSPAVDAIADTLEQPSIIFTPFKEAFPHIINQLSDATDFPIYWIHGGLTGTQRDSMLENYRQKPGVLLSTIRLGQGWTLTEAKSVYFLGMDWNPDMHYQAESRIHRIGQTDNVLVRYLIHPDSIEEYMMQIIEGKMQMQEFMEVITQHADFATSKGRA